MFKSIFSCYISAWLIFYQGWVSRYTNLNVYLSHTKYYLINLILKWVINQKYFQRKICSLFLIFSWKFPLCPVFWIMIKKWLEMIKTWFISSATLTLPLTSNSKSFLHARNLFFSIKSSQGIQTSKKYQN